jgi:hypothetical protein
MARKPKATTAAVAASQAKTLEAGGGWIQKTLLNAEDMALWEAAQEKIGGPERGRAKRTIIAALQALGGRKRPSKAELIQLLESRLTD